MSRLVVPKTTSNGRLANAGINEMVPDTYKDRLIKYIPAEAVAFYACVDKLLISHFGLENLGAGAIVPMVAIIFSWAFLLLGIVGTPIYLRRQKKAGQPWKLQAGLSTVAFVLWAYTLSGSVFLIYHGYDVFYAALLAPIFTFVAGLFEPRAQ